MERERETEKERRAKVIVNTGQGNAWTNFAVVRNYAILACFYDFLANNWESIQMFKPAFLIITLEVVYASFL